MHVLCIALIVRSALLLQDRKRRVAAERCRHIQRVRKHALFARAVPAYTLIDQPLHHSRVDRKALSHESESRDHIVLALPDRDRVDLRHRKLRCRIVELQKTIRISRQRVHRKRFPVYLLHDRHVLAHAQIVTRPRKERSHRVDGLPQAIRLRVVGERFRDQERAPVHILLLLREMDPPIPHHRPEIALELLVALVVPARDILRVILKLRGDLRFRNTLRSTDPVKLVRHTISHITVHRNTVVEQPGTDREKRHIALCRTLPLTAPELLILRDTVVQHTSAQRGHAVREITFLNIF